MIQSILGPAPVHEESSYICIIRKTTVFAISKLVLFDEILIVGYVRLATERRKVTQCFPTFYGLSPLSKDAPCPAIKLLSVFHS